MDNLAPQVTLDSITVYNEDFCILNDISITFPPGKCSVIMGIAGSGKSSLIKTAAGLIIPREGRVLIQSMDVFGFSKKEELAFRKISGFVFQDSALWQDTTSFLNVTMPLRIHYNHLDPKVMYTMASTILRRIGFDDNQNLRPAELSIGEQKLVSIARAVIHEPRLLYLDDPTSNLDEDSIEKIFTLIEEQKKRNITIIIGTNNSDIAYRFADYLGVIKNGKILAFGNYDETLNKVEHVLSSSLARLRARGTRKKEGSGEI